MTGSHWVRALRPAMDDAKKWLPRTRDRAELRRHALKLRFWPERNPLEENGTVLDVDWSWIKSLKGLTVGELRIQDEFGGCDNLRIIFYVPGIKIPYPCVWVLSVLQKKRMDFTKAQLDNFRLRRTLVNERFYNGTP
jgi:hypothetical protein